MLAYFEHAAARGEPVYLYGSTDATLAALAQRLRARWPELRIAGMHSPPFRPTTEAEDEDSTCIASMPRAHGRCGSVWAARSRSSGWLPTAAACRP